MSRMLETWARLAAVSIVALGCAAGSGDDGVGGAGAAGGQEQTFTLGAPTDPTTCEEAAGARSYLGCDFWPTVTRNTVWSIFDFAVVVANVGAETTEVTIESDGVTVAQATVEPSEVLKIPLPWVPELKGADCDTCGVGSPAEASSARARGAYHLTSSRPIVVYQFNALEYEGNGGTDGKDWQSCPGFAPCVLEDGATTTVGCFSFSNDAALLLPSTAMTGSYRISALDDSGGQAHFAITATADNTSVTLRASKTATILAGGPVPAINPGVTATFSMNAGDVVQLVSAGGGDLAGSVVLADKPVQVLAGAGCARITDSSHPDASCDHLEESVLPAETLGARYVIAAPTGPLGTPDPYRVRLIGNVDGTTLSFPAGAPGGAPATIDAGEVVDLGVIQGDLEIIGGHELAVTTFLTSADLSNPDNFLGQGDPSQTQAVAVEQFRDSYVFLAPDDYDVSFIDVVMPLDATLTLDDAPFPAEPTPIGSSGLGVARARLGRGRDGAHSLSADQPIGVQVIGYGAYTSYQYPAGLYLEPIAPPPQ
jgi:hypothetical protein